MAGVVLFYIAFFILSGAVVAAVESLFPEEVDRIAEFLGFGEKPYWME